MASTEPGHYLLDAGESHGITENSEFAVYADGEMTTFLGTAIALKPSAFTTSCVPSVPPAFALHGPAYALQRSLEDDNAACRQDDPVGALCELLTKIERETKTGSFNFHLEDGTKDAVLAVSGKACFAIKEQYYCGYGLNRMTFNPSH